MVCNWGFYSHKKLTDLCSHNIDLGPLVLGITGNYSSTRHQQTAWVAKTGNTCCIQWAPFFLDITTVNAFQKTSKSKFSVKIIHISYLWNLILVVWRMQSNQEEDTEDGDVPDTIRVCPICYTMSLIVCYFIMRSQIGFLCFAHWLLIVYSKGDRDLEW